MFKNNEKRFEYDISPLTADQYDHMMPHYQPRRQFPISATTPINRRTSISHHQLDTRDKHHISVQQPHHLQYQQRAIPRQRGSSSGFKRSSQKPANRHSNAHLAQQSFKQTKKVYFGGNDPFEPNPSRYDHSGRPSRNNDENRRVNGEEMISYENGEIQNFKSGQRKKQKLADYPQYNLNEKEIMQKIGRINRLNQQINSRLQRMLTKIDQS